jgi:hypothetical protein
MGEPFDREAAVISVRPALRRQRHRRSA